MTDPRDVTCCMTDCNKPATVKTVDLRLSFCSEHSVIGSEAAKRLGESLAVWADKTTTPEVIGTDPRDLEIAALRAEVERLTREHDEAIKRANDAFTAFEVARRKP